MKVIVTSLTNEELERRDYRDIMIIEIDGKKVFSVYDGEPEDSNLSRDFNDCWKIPTLIQMAHKAGADGEPLYIENVEVDEW